MDFNFIEYDSNDLKKDMFNNASESLKKQGADDWTLYPGDERYQILSAMTYCNMIMLAKINKALLNSTINGATAEALDEVGKIRNCYRKEPGKSTVTLRFSLLQKNLVQFQPGNYMLMFLQNVRQAAQNHRSMTSAK